MTLNARQREAELEWPTSWPSFSEFLGPLAQYIISTLVFEAKGGDQAIIRFDNGYGVSIYQAHGLDALYFEVTPVRFRGRAITDYESILPGIPFTDDLWRYVRADILDFCNRISLL
jgi:hypothetical protein